MGKLGGVTALILLTYVLATMVVLLGLGGPPTTAQETLEMLHQNRLSSHIQRQPKSQGKR